MKKIYYFTGTHWDREWYLPFQEFRLNLDIALSGVLDFLASNEDIVFYLDGQTIPLLDYIKVRPERDGELREFIRRRRLIVGPWFVMPDEFLVSGEAFMRNLKKGHDVAASFGQEAWKVGYVCDIFGHTSQMPQILNQFGIHTAVLGRGTNDITTDMFFRWEAPDGTQCITYHLPDDNGYGAFTTEVTGARRLKVVADPESAEFESKCKAYIDRELSRSNTGDIAIMDALDHEPVHDENMAYIQKIKQWYPDYEVVAMDFEEFFVGALGRELQVRKGELLDTAPKQVPYLHQIANTLSSRCDIKHRNDHCQNLLERFAEPFASLLSKENLFDTKPYLALAWNYLLQNQAHDSICGCSIARVHQDMQYRYSQVEQLSTAIDNELSYRLAGIKGFVEGESETLNLFNPLPYSVTKTLTVDIPFSAGYSKQFEPFGYEFVPSFRLFDALGTELPYRIHSIRHSYPLRLYRSAVAFIDMVTLSVSVTLAPFGFTPINVVVSNETVRYLGSTAEQDTLENEYLRVQVQDDGRVTIIDKVNQRIYANQLGILSDTELGDGWFSVRAACGKENVRALLLGVEITDNNESGATLLLRKRLSLPKQVEITHKECKESDQYTDVDIYQHITLNAGEPFLRVKMDIHNTALDRRYRLAVPTYADTHQYHASQQFAFVTRPCGVDMSTKNYHELSGLEKNTSGIVYRTHSQGHGLAFVSGGGIHEVGCDNDSHATMFITLLRGIRNTPGTYGELDGEMLGTNTFSFALAPISGEEDNRLLHIQETLQTPTYSLVSKAPISPALQGIALSGAIISAIKPLDKENGLLIRVFTLSAPSKVTLSLPIPMRICRCDGLEKTTDVLAEKSDGVSVEAGPYQILGIKVLF